MSTCFAPGCNTGYLSARNRNKLLGIKNPTLFAAPKDTELLEKWRRAIPRKDKIFGMKDRLCELHFDEDSMIRNFETKLFDGSISRIPREFPRLKPQSVPNKFPNLPKSSKNRKRKVPATRITETKKEKKNNLDAMPAETSIKELQLPTEDFKYEMFTYDLENVIKPDLKWTVSYTEDFIVCAKWSTQGSCERRVFILKDFSTKIFLKDLEINLEENPIETSESLSHLLSKVNGLIICKGVKSQIIENKGVKMKEVSILRRKEWLARLSRADLNDSNLKYRKVCSEHFIHGKPSSLLDVTNPDWAPSLKLGHSRYKADRVEAINRYTSFPKHVTVSSNDQKEQGRPKQITESNKNFDETTSVHHEEMNKSQEAAADIICDSNVYNTEVLENMVMFNEKDDCQLPLEKRDTEDTSDSEEEISEKSSENVFHLCKSSTSHDGIAFVKRKLEQATAQYEKAQKKKILYEQKCKLYEKQMSALKEVLNNLQLINSFSDLT